MSKREVRFQEHAFDRGLGGRKPIDELLSIASKEDLQDSHGYMYGFQIKRFRTGYKKDIPDWAKTYAGVQKILLTAFPRLHFCPKQRRGAGRWAQVLYLYYFKGFSQSQIAGEINTNAKIVNNILLRSSLVSKGFRADGGGSRLQL